MNRAWLVVLVLAVLAMGGCRKAEPAAPVVPATAAPEPVPATPQADARAAPDAASPQEAPAAPAAPEDLMFACGADADCTILWLGRGCLPGDPMAVARAHEAGARKKYTKGPPLACGMGGPRYDADRRAILARYGVACRGRKCSLVDHGPQPSAPVEPTNAIAARASRSALLRSRRACDRVARLGDRRRAGRTQARAGPRRSSLR